MWLTFTAWQKLFNTQNLVDKHQRHHITYFPTNLWCSTKIYFRSTIISYVNGLPLVSNLSIKLFADDTVLSMSNSCINKLMHNINNELTKIDYWMRINKLSINYSKTKCMIISNKNIMETIKLKLGIMR